jgi:hypothetical protein
VPAERTIVSELGTALGMLGVRVSRAKLGRRPNQLLQVTDEHWERLASLWTDAQYREDFLGSISNGRAFLTASDGLASRKPREVVWTGGRRALGDESIPVDLRIDHVYLVSCKYLSRILQNPSPARLFEGLLATGLKLDETDWYSRTAPEEYLALYRCSAGDLARHEPQGLSRHERRELGHRLSGQWQPDALEKYGRLCEAVSSATARIWRENVSAIGSERMLWRLLRIGPAPYFVLGSDKRQAMRLRIDTPWDWREKYRLQDFTIEPQGGGQPRVGWSARYRDRVTGTTNVVQGHVEVRWSHGRFAQPPEAKVYLDTPQLAVPGYNPI